MSPVTDNLPDFKTGTYVVTRTLAATFTNGRAVPNVQTTFNVDATVFPSGAGELLRLEEGERTRESLVVITTGSLRDGGGGYEPDVIAIHGHTYQVANVEDWTDYGFVKAVVVKRERS